MHERLPIVQGDPAILDVCTAVGEGKLPVDQAQAQIRTLIQPILNGCQDANKATVLAVRLVEDIVKASKGVFFTDDDLADMWSLEEAPLDPHAELRFVFTVVSLIRISTFKEVHEGAKAISIALDMELPEEV